MDMRKLVGRNFARIRKRKGLTQEQVEERSGFSQQYLSPTLPIGALERRFLGVPARNRESNQRRPMANRL